jgi:hypothetical protein
MGRWVIAVVAAGVVLVAAAARAQTDQVVLAPTVYASHNLPSDAITGFTVTCAPGHVAVSAGVSTPGQGSILLSVRPVGLRAYTFRFGNPATNDPTRVTVAVACRKIRPPGPVFVLKPVKTRLVVGPGRQKSGTLACPPQTTPAGAAVDLDPGRAKSVDSFAGAALSVRSTTATLRELQFRIANAGSRAHAVVVNGTCVTILIAPKVERAKLNTTISTYTNVIAPGRHRLQHRCRSGWTSLGAGYALASGAARIDGAAALNTSGAWWVRNTAASPLTARLQVICARVA